jgi:hypothetical protein
LGKKIERINCQTFQYHVEVGGQKHRSMQKKILEKENWTAHGIDLKYIMEN